MTHDTIRPQPGIMDIKLYVGGESAIQGANRVIKLSSNENPLGPSPRAIQAMQDAASKIAAYPDSGHHHLRAAIGKVNNLPPEQIICGAGSDEIIAFLCQTYAGPGDEVIHTEHGFGMYKISAKAAGATPVEVREDTRKTDVDAILAACTENTKLVFIANPNNPTGTMISDAEILRLAKGIPPQAILVLDGAYVEFVRDPGFDAGAALVKARDNVVMTRTFSKIYGLASLRIGWGFGPQHIIDTLNRVRGPFNLSGPAIAAAIAAVEDVDYTAHCALQNEVWRDWLARDLARIGLPSDPAFGNFILVDFGKPDRAEAADQALRNRGIIVRRVAGYNLPNHLRITIGDEEGCKAVCDALHAFVKGEN